VNQEPEWSVEALNSAAGFLVEDAPGLTALMLRLDRLEGSLDEPDVVLWGSKNLVRVHVGAYRAVVRLRAELALPPYVVHVGRRTT
jgi:hypothetical protein